jgi:murein DD-endopeptidase MepM/ murein hydrolase activator NlpD
MKHPTKPTSAVLALVASVVILTDVADVEAGARSISEGTIPVAAASNAVGADGPESSMSALKGMISRFTAFTAELDGAGFSSVLERFVQAQMNIRDLMRSAETSLASFSDKMIAVAARHREGLDQLVPKTGVRDETSWVSIDLTILSAEPVPGRQSSGFGWRSDPFHQGRKFHRGTDVRAPHGTPIGAAGPGMVILAGRQNGYGNVVYVDHGGGLVTRYGHMQSIATKKGAAVTAGQLIGKVGATGRATGPHLHFEVRLDGRAVNPIDAMNVAELKRAGDPTASLAMLTLSPEKQETANSKQDPPRSRFAKALRKDKHAKSRPERHGRGKRARIVS